MKDALKPEELQPNAFVTVLEWTDKSNSSYVGSVLQIHVIDLPFIVVTRESNGAKEPFSLDTRRCTFATLSDKYVQAMCSQG